MEHWHAKLAIVENKKAMLVTARVHVSLRGSLFVSKPPPAAEIETYLLAAQIRSLHRASIEKKGRREGDAGQAGADRSTLDVRRTAPLALWRSNGLAVRRAAAYRRGRA